MLLVAQASADMIATNSALAACAINPQPLRSSEDTERGVVNQSMAWAGSPRLSPSRQQFPLRQLRPPTLRG